MRRFALDGASRRCRFDIIPKWEHLTNRVSVPRYRYRCPADGPFDMTFPIGTAPASIECEQCCAASNRVYGGGAMVRSNPAGNRALDLHAQSQANPGVVRRSPGPSDPARLRYADPRHRMLPKP
ncbi:hypothetical protein SAMN04488581_0574 [Mycolicibacterium neoaurum]|jgi:hypothetical protein|nr:hypothetical protein SAMN04488581_0574 [Mycolicibacterium neoaurum]